MFTWEEAGLLRSMLLVIKWTIVAAAFVGGTYFRRPLLNAANAMYHSVDVRIHGRLVGSGPPPSAGPH